MITLSEEYTKFLKVLRFSLFSENSTDFNKFNIPHIISESKTQTVFPLVYSALEGKCDLTQYASQYYSVISNNIRIVEEHKKIHTLLTQSGIPYVFLKGCASARYYPDPLLRTMGDVDILIMPEDTEKAEKILISAGYERLSETDNLGSHIEYRSQNGITCELHRQINGIPKTEVGSKISCLFSDIFKKSILHSNEYQLPSDFHHGLILLIHTATHLTHEGIGLRHLCDWAVFAASLTDEQFLCTFEKQLKNVGLWKFAVILTQFAIKYLGCPHKAWAGELDEALLQKILEDVFSGGNFGKKDYSRYQHIKYIADRDYGTPNNDSALKRVFHNALVKAKNETLVKRIPVFLPIGFIVVILKYLWLIIIGKRRPDNKNIITEASERKRLYDNFELYK